VCDLGLGNRVLFGLERGQWGVDALFGVKDRVAGGFVMNGFV
jgi:hypothetical protein